MSIGTRRTSPKGIRLQDTHHFGDQRHGRKTEQGRKVRQAQSRREARRRRPASAQQHPGEVLREILADTPPALAAKWFGLSTTELEAFYNGELPLTLAMAETAGSIFGTGAAPWLDMMAAWDEAHATEKAAP